MKIRTLVAVVAVSCVGLQGPALASIFFGKPAQVPAETSAPPAKTYSVTPTGEGEPGAITCRPPQKLAGSRMMGPEVCKTNAVWKRYALDGMEVAADGIHDVPAEKFRTLNPRSCRPVTMGGGGTLFAFSTSFSQICD